MLALHIVSAVALIVWTVGGGIGISVYFAKKHSKPEELRDHEMTKYQDKY